MLVKITCKFRKKNVLIKYSILSIFVKKMFLILLLVFNGSELVPTF